MATKFQKISEVIRRIDNYVSASENNVPLISELCAWNKWFRPDFVELYRNNEKVKRAVDILFCVQETMLIKHSLFGSFHKPMAVYLLDRLERIQKDMTGNLELRLLDQLLRADVEAANAIASSDDDDEDDDETETLVDLYGGYDHD